ncbi:hypothetical protein JTL48_34700, partial [Pseudomonas aeruginosa]|nr:hypothetical protein [Pseudomonas aeruginosa]
CKHDFFQATFVSLPPLQGWGPHQVFEENRIAFRKGTRSTATARNVTESHRLHYPTIITHAAEPVSDDSPSERKVSTFSECGGCAYN